MAEGTVVLPPDSTGKTMRTQTNAGVAGGAHQPVQTLADAAGNLLGATAAGAKTVLDVNIAASGSPVPAVSAALTGNGASVSANIASSGNATITLFGGTFTNLPVIFEASADGGTTWFPIDVTRSDGQWIGVATTIPSQAALPMAFNTMLPGYTNVRVRQTGVATAQTVNPTAGIYQGPFLVDSSPTVPPVDGTRLTYSAVLNAAAAASAVTTSAPLWELVNTGAGVTLRIIRLSFQLTLATAGAAPLLLLQKRTLASTGGTSTLGSSVPYDSSARASAATSRLYTVAPALAGTGVNVRSLRVYGVATTMVAQPPTFELTFGNRPSQALILRSNESLNLQGIAAFATAPTLTGDVEWTEE